MTSSAHVGQPNISEHTVIETVRRQIHTDQEIGLVVDCDETVIERVVTEAVLEMWATSRIKTYLPVLALRRARDEIRVTAGLR
jgi:phosphatidate phosphatase APP1